MEDMNPMVNKAMLRPYVHKADCECGLCLTKRASDKVAETIQNTKDAAAGAT